MNMDSLRLTPLLSLEGNLAEISRRTGADGFNTFVCTCLLARCCITLFEIKQHSRFMEEGEHRHVLNFIELWRVLRVDISLLMGYSLK